MPLEIKELNIKINVEEDKKSSGQNAAGTDDKETIIAACVEQVMDILSKIQER